MFIHSYLDIKNILKTLEEKHYLYAVHGTFDPETF